MMEYEDDDMHLDEGSGNILLDLTRALVVDQTMKIRRMDIWFGRGRTLPTTLVVKSLHIHVAIDALNRSKYAKSSRGFKAPQSIVPAAGSTIK
jgi:hypothetical protein